MMKMVGGGFVMLLMNDAPGSEAERRCTMQGEGVGPGGRLPLRRALLQAAEQGGVSQRARRRTRRRRNGADDETSSAFPEGFVEQIHGTLEGCALDLRAAVTWIESKVEAPLVNLTM